MTAVRAVLALATAVLMLAQPHATSADAQYPRGLLSGATSGCVIETQPIAFGSYDVLSTVMHSAQGKVTYACGGSLPTRNIRIDLSRGGAGSFQRRMASGIERLLYNVYLDASHHNVWGDGSDGTDYYVASYPPSSTQIEVPIYGMIPSRQDVPVGSYGDVLQVRILF